MTRYLILINILISFSTVIAVPIIEKPANIITVTRNFEGTKSSDDEYYPIASKAEQLVVFHVLNMFLGESYDQIGIENAVKVIESEIQREKENISKANSAFEEQRQAVTDQEIIAYICDTLEKYLIDSKLKKENFTLIPKIRKKILFRNQEVTLNLKKTIRSFLLQKKMGKASIFSLTNTGNSEQQIEQALIDSVNSANTANIDKLFSYSLLVDSMEYSIENKETIDDIVSAIGEDKIDLIREDIAYRKLEYRDKFFIKLGKEGLFFSGIGKYITILENARKKLLKNRTLSEELGCLIPASEVASNKTVVVFNEMIFGKTIPIPNGYLNSLLIGDKGFRFHNNPFLVINTLEETICSKKEDLNTPQTEINEPIFSLLLDQTKEKYESLANYKNDLEKASAGTTTIHAFKNTSKIIHNQQLLSEYEKRSYFREYDDGILKFGMFYKFGQQNNDSFLSQNKISISTCRDVKCGLFGGNASKNWIITSNTLDLDGITINRQSPEDSVKEITKQFPRLKRIIQADPKFGGTYIIAYSFGEDKITLCPDKSFRSSFDIVFKYGNGVTTTYSIKLFSGLIE